MYKYIVFLRGINVGGRKKIKMDDLRQLLEKLGFKAVRTYIQSGNIVFDSPDMNSHGIASLIAKSIYNAYGFEIMVIVKSIKDIEKIFRNNPYTNSTMFQENQMYFVLLKTIPDAQLRYTLETEDCPNEEFMITKDCVYLHCKKGYGNAKCDNNFFERKLKVNATTRNYRTIKKLLEMSLSK